MSPELADLQTAIDRARTIERQERDAQTRQQFDQVDRLGQALQMRHDLAGEQTG
jgi:hypothetical protein